MSIEDTICDADTYRSVPETFKYRGLCLTTWLLQGQPPGKSEQQQQIATDSPVKMVYVV
jgi:hypothetical protein